MTLISYLFVSYEILFITTDEKELHPHFKYFRKVLLHTDSEFFFFIKKKRIPFSPISVKLNFVTERTIVPYNNFTTPNLFLHIDSSTIYYFNTSIYHQSNTSQIKSVIVKLKISTTPL